MVSLYLNPPAPDFYMMDPMKIGLPVLNSVPPDSATTAADIVVAGNANLSTGLLTEDPNKKVRKPYTITKSRESWTEQEHDKFLEALHLFDRDWKKIEAFVGSKTVIQIRSHAQKYFLKVQKNGISEHVPPPRPKRKATHPYPQKAPKKVTTPFQSSCALFETAPYIIGQDSVVVPGNMFSSANLTSWPSSNVPLVSTSQVMKDDVELSCETMGHNSCSGSNQSPPKVCPTRGTHNQGKEKQNKPMRAAMPDFAQVYNFIGSLFDPNKSDHLQKLKKMDPINVETVLLLMKNLSVNLTSPEFENHRRMLSSYDVDSAKVITSSSSQFNNFHPGSRMLEA